MESKFLTWFVQQHGPRTASGMADKTDQQLYDLIHAGQEADRIMQARDLWDARRESALYAWQAAQPPQGPQESVSC